MPRRRSIRVSIVKRKMIAYPVRARENPPFSIALSDKKTELIECRRHSISVSAAIVLCLGALAPECLG